MEGMIDWLHPDPALARWVEDQRQNVIRVYRADPKLVEEHARQEDAFRTGGYADRQVLELVQNAADALTRSGARGRIGIVLHDDTLYCANEGAPFGRAGLEAICHAYLSDKRDEEIGRFGLGFKSVLGVSDTPTVLSRSVGVAFGPETTAAALAGLVPTATRLPILRIPVAVDLAVELDRDPVLAEMSSWAQTIIKLPIAHRRQHLIDEIANFPLEFLLFAPDVESLHLRLPQQPERHYRCEHLGPDRRRLHRTSEVVNDATDWLVLNQQHRPSDEALAEVGDAIARPEITVSYAAPLDDRTSLGRFWAYFPLQDATSARGIHNAPWRINDDRTNLLPGRFNEEILDVATQLIVEALPQLVATTDPARHFDYLPARGREAANFADRILTEIVPAHAATTRCVPDMDGVLRHPDELSYPQFDLRLEHDTLGLWASAPGRPARWAHPDCYRTTARRARLRTLVRHDDAVAADTEVEAVTWLQHVVDPGTDSQCAVALRIYRSVADGTTRSALAQARVIPGTDDQLHRLSATGSVFLRGNRLSMAAGLHLVREGFLDLPDAEAQLRSLGFVDVDAAHELALLSNKIGSRWNATDWSTYWDLVNEVPMSEAARTLRQHLTLGRTLKVRCQDGSWQHIGSVIVEGPVRPTDRSLVLDTDFHGRDQLAELGVDDHPHADAVTLHDLTLLEYLRHLRSDYLAALPSRGRPDRDAVMFVEHAELGPLHVLRRFLDSGDETAAEGWTKMLLEADTADTWTLHAGKAKFPTRAVMAPRLWAAENYGRVATGWGPRKSAHTLHPDLAARWGSLLPVAAWPVSTKINTIPDLEHTPVDLWREFVDRTPTGGSPWQLAELLHIALSRLPKDEIPDLLPAVSGDGYAHAARHDVLLARTDDECRALRATTHPFIATVDDEAAEQLTTAWELRPAASVLQVEVMAENPGIPTALLDRFRRLRDYDAQDLLGGIELVDCDTLLEVISEPGGTSSNAQDFAVSADTVYCIREPDGTLDEERLLTRLSEHFDLRLDLPAIDKIRSDAEDSRIREHSAACRAATDVADKLLALLPIRSLETKLPVGLLDAVRQETDDRGDRQVADLLILVHGDNVLIELRQELLRAGLEPPHQWAGSPGAIAFVRRLGFPTEYAGERNASKDADFISLGPPNLPDLHPYQREIATQVRDLLRERDPAGRALLVLPTGAGKTRVTAQSLIEAITENELRGPVLWIAQSEELCEQAVQTWHTIWRELGDRPLRICRLWGSNEIAEDDSTTVVITTDAKLDSIRKRDGYEWLQRASIVIIDEAHGAIAEGITATQRWLGIDAHRTERPLLGLTATAFKGTGEDANRRLVNRFGQRRFAIPDEDAYRYLQRLGVLAGISHRVLKGSRFRLDSSEVDKFNTFREVPKTVLERVGRDTERNQRLLQDILAQPREWPILVFTSSVLAAHTLSALLRVRGVRSASVSGTTPGAERRRSIEAFRRGDIQVLTNCNVLTEGFDAPGVRALYIARPTYSPNAYIQMVGRGLRGPLNGGKDECLVVNIEDTFDRFGDSLAYKDFDYLWTGNVGARNGERP